MNTTMGAEVCRNYTEDWINYHLEPRKTVDRIEGFVIVAAVFIIALAILSPRRRQSRSIIIRYGVGGVFILSFPLLSYTVGLMQAEKIKNELYPVWAMFLAMLFGGTSSMSVQKLDQNKQLMKLYCDCLLFSMCVGTVLAGFIYTFGTKHSSSRLIPFIGCLFVVGYLLGIKTAEQWNAARLASEPSPDNGIKWLALYMKHLLPTEKGGKPVELPMQVKRAVARTIKNSTNGHLSHGTSALMRHGMGDELCAACQINDEYTLTDNILAWHVATSFCEISDTIKRPHDVHPNQIVATILSKYCTYLVAFAPTLLPGSAPEMKCALDELVKEAKEMLHDLVSPREKYEKLSELEYVLGGERKLFTYGVELGKALESMENHASRWDLLADFWAEMMVYIAPSNNVAGHIELLVEGGEFVTHVWALLMHAGILERPSTAVP